MLCTFLYRTRSNIKYVTSIDARTFFVKKSCARKPFLKNSFVKKNCTRKRFVRNVCEETFFKESYMREHFVKKGYSNIPNCAARFSKWERLKIFDIIIAKTLDRF